MEAISIPSPKCYRLPIYNFVSYDYKSTFSHTAAIWDFKMVPIIAFSNYEHVNQIYAMNVLQNILTECSPFYSRVHNN